MNNIKQPNINNYLSLNSPFSEYTNLFLGRGNKLADYPVSNQKERFPFLFHLSIQDFLGKISHLTIKKNDSISILNLYHLNKFLFFFGALNLRFAQPHVPAGS